MNGEPVVAKSRTLMVGVVLGAVIGALVAVPAAVWATHRFADVPDNHPHRAGIDWVADVGITGGCDAENYCPKAPVSRAQMATFLHRASGQAGVAASFDAAELGGVAAAGYQRRVTGSCVAGEAITAIAADGSVTCAPTGDRTPELDVLIAEGSANDVGGYAQCPSGYKALGGGFRAAHYDYYANLSYPADSFATGWSVRFNDTQGSFNAYGTAYAVCVRITTAP